jgi:hypothetical protein
MSDSSKSISENFYEEELDEENVILTSVPVTEEPNKNI